MVAAERVDLAIEVTVKILLWYHLPEEYCVVLLDFLVFFVSVFSELVVVQRIFC